MKQTKVMSAQEYAQGKELVKRLCNLFGGNFVPDIPVPAEENLAAKLILFFDMCKSLS